MHEAYVPFTMET